MAACARLAARSAPADDILAPGLRRPSRVAARGDGDRLDNDQRWAGAGHYEMPIVLMTPSGSGIRGSLYHSHSFESWASRLAGWKIVMPSNALDAYGLMLSAIADPNPVLVLLPKRAAHHSPSAMETGMTGLLSGILTGFAGMPGPPVIPYYLRRAITPELARASMMTIFLATSLAGVVAAFALGVATLREAVLAALLFPAVLLGNWLVIGAACAVLLIMAARRLKNRAAGFMKQP